MYIPQEIDTYLAQFRKQMLETENADDRAKIAIACETPEKFCKVCRLDVEKADALKQFAKKQKVPWQIVVMTFGMTLQNKTHFVIGYKFPQYIKAFLKRVDIPVFDVADPDKYAELKNSVFCETPMALAKDICHAYKRQLHSDYLAYNTNTNSYQFIDKVAQF